MADERLTTATVVFTDMVGSSALRARLGEERADTLRGIHDALLTARVTAWAGRVLKGLGDGLVAVFAAASDGLSAAVEMQQAICAYNRRRDALAQMSVRVGLSTGDVSWEGGDCFGTPMVEAARLEAVAEGGQILCSEYVRMMARGRGGHEFRPVGPLELKGLPEPLSASEVVWTPGPEPGGMPLPSELAVAAARPFVSRTAELQLADLVLADRGRNRATVLWVLGEPGIGKTRLATEIARLAHHGGALVLFGRCSEDLPVPYQPFLEALRWFLEYVTDDQLPARLGAFAGELTRLVPELGERVPGLEASRSTSPEIEQHRLFEALRSWLAAAGADRPVLAVLDDVHWGDRSTLALLGHITRSAERSRAILVCTARTTSPDDNPALAALAEELERRAAPSHRLELVGLDVEEVGELVSVATGRALDDRVRITARQLQAETAGNPLYLDALLANLSGGAVPSEGEIPRSLSETVSRRVGRLPRDVADLLRVAALEGLDFDLRVTARAAGRDELAVLESLEGAVRAGLVEEPAPNRYRFAHALVRAALREELSRSRRVRLHLAVGEAIEAVFGDHLDEHVPALAYHYFEAVPAGGAAKAYRYAVLAGERATRLVSHHEAVQAYGRALQLLDRFEGGNAVTSCELLLALGEAGVRAGEAEASEAFVSAAEIARVQGDAERLARAALGFADVWERTGVADQARISHLEEALTALGQKDSPLRAQLLGRLASKLNYAAGSMERRDALTAEAVEVARRVGDPVVLAGCLDTRNAAMWGPGGAEERLAAGEEIVRLAHSAGDRELALSGHAWCQIAFLEMGEVAGLDAHLSAYERIAEELRQPRYRWYAWTRRAMRALLAGDLDDAERLAREALVLGRGGGEPDADNVFSAQLVTLALERPTDEPWEHFEGWLPSVESDALPHVAVARGHRMHLALESGRTDVARNELNWFRRVGIGKIDVTWMWTVTMVRLAPVIARMGTAEEAEALYAALLPFAAGNAMNGGAVTYEGSYSYYLGVLATALGRWDAADRHFATAAAMHEGMGARAWLTRTRLEWSEMLVARSRPRDLESAMRLLHLVDESATRLGLTGVAERACALRGHGADRAPLVTSGDG